ncbi:MAG: STAS domain-containing protein [Thermoanaerobaculum sp.]|nr:STAS domain-containing protein [Thermoanaerobaculum sp.]
MSADWLVSERAGVKVLRLDRELDPDALTGLEELLSGLVASAKPRLVVDLSSCPRVTSEMLRFFLVAARRVEAQGGGFALASPSPEVQRFLELSGVARLCRVLPSLDEAQQAVQGNERMEALAHKVLALLERAERRETAYPV